MVAPHDGILAVVIGDDAVAAGMLALDLVQAGFDAHGAGDVWAAAERLRAGRHAEAPPVLIAIYRDLRRTLEVWRHLQDEGVRVRVVVAVSENDLVAAEAAAMAGGWLGVVRAPVRTEALTDLLDRHALGASHAHGVERGDLSEVNITTVLERELLAARRDPGRRNSLLRVERGGLVGEIALVDGELAHAQVERDSGRHALERLACWREGEWVLTPNVHAGQHTLSGGWRGVLAAVLEYARRVEEARRSMPLRDHVCTVRWERVRPLPVVAEALFRRIAGGQRLHEALDGRGDDELEAYAALLTRIRRGAVEPLEQTLSESPSLHRTDTHRRPDMAASGASGARIMSGVRPSGGHHIRTSESHRRPYRMRAASSATIAVRGVEAGAPVSSPEPGPVAEGRHSDTATYQAVPLGPFVGHVPADLPEIPVDAVREHTPTHAPVLPLSLPDNDSDEWEAAPVPQAPSEPVFAATGWFGLNVGKAPNTDLSARVDAMRDALVQGGETSAADQLQARMSQSVAELPRAATISDAFAGDEIESHYSHFATDAEIDDAYEADNERSQLELLAPSGVGGRRARVFWLVALVVVVSILGLVIWPGSPIYEGQATRPTAVRSYQRAVDLIDAGKEQQAAALLRLVHGRTSVPPEATLQLAVLDVKARRFDEAQSNLRAYLKLPDARHIKSASRLYTHVFGAAP